MHGSHFDKIVQIDLKPAVVEKRWLVAIIMTGKRTQSSCWVRLLPITLACLILCLHSLPTDDHFENCINITKPFQEGHLPFYIISSDCNVLNSMEIALNNLTQYSHRQVEHCVDKSLHHNLIQVTVCFWGRFPD